MAHIQRSLEWVDLTQRPPSYHLSEPESSDVECGFIDHAMHSSKRKVVKLPIHIIANREMVMKMERIKFSSDCKCPDYDQSGAIVI